MQTTELVLATFLTNVYLRHRHHENTGTHQIAKDRIINQVGRQTECGCLFGCCTHDDICQLAGKIAAVRGTIWFL